MSQTLQFKQQTSQYPSLTLSQGNLQRNQSLKVKTSKSLIQPKSPRKTIERKKPSENSYIAKAFANIQNDCLDEKTGKIKIDGDYGDYRMRIFRKKDKLKHYNDPSSIFSEKQFVQKIWNYANCGIKKNQLLQKQDSSQLEEINSQKKVIRQQRTRLGLKRQNSIISPSLREPESQKVQKSIQFSTEQNSELMNKINQILSKPRDHYIYKPVQNQEEQEEKNKLKKGVQQQLRQKQGHLFYRSIPQYMAEKWFKTVDNSTPDGNYVTPYVEQKPVPPPPKKHGHKRTHIFRSLQQNYQLNVSKVYKSMIAY